MFRRFGRAATVLAAASLVVVAAPVPAFADGVRADQWYLDALDVGKAHELSQGEGVTIGLIDGGVDATHPDLKGSVKAGKDFGTEGKGLKDEDGHGTWTSSLIVGHGHGEGNADGVLGIAPKAEVVSVGVSTKDSSSKSGVADAITWLVDQDVDVISVSMSAGADYDSVEYATGKGIQVVASAGNCVVNDSIGEFENTFMSWPASSPGAIPVSGTTEAGKFWECSIDLGSAAPQPKLGLSAPGKDIMGAEKGGGHAAHSGTSASAPIVAGTLALIKSAYPDLDYEQVNERLLETVDDKGPKEFDDRFGWGIVNPYKALTEDVKHFKGDPSTQDDIVPLADQGKNTGNSDKGKDGKKSDGDDNALTASSTSLLIPVLIAVAALLVVAFVVILVIAKRRNKTPPPPVAPPGTA